ncbi:DNA cytosine methyltransferase [Flavobacteriaceae bacterium]|nr:DNA cytosine methyltransferase [Flavobacteriaceae bacterium]
MNIKNEINVLSLFDGISVAQLALNELNIPIHNYFASEVDKNAIKVTQHHFPGTVQLGDVRQVDGTTLPPIDLLIFGSPCQDLSSMRKDRSGLAGEQSGLFFDALRILKEVNPKYFVMENVGSMSKFDCKVISDLLGVEPIKINSSLLGPALRNRYYWTNIKGIEVPIDAKNILKNHIESGYVDRRKANAVLTKNVPYTVKGLKRYLNKSIGQVVFLDKDFANTAKNVKLDIIENMTDDEARKLFRLSSITELERLQKLPDGYVGDILKKTPAHHAIGNSFTNEVIKHILSYADFN